MSELLKQILTNIFAVLIAYDIVVILFLVAAIPFIKLDEKWRNKLIDDIYERNSKLINDDYEYNTQLIDRLVADTTISAVQLNARIREQRRDSRLESYDTVNALPSPYWIVRVLSKFGL